ncbi:MAG: (2Fe-2S)-binding protein [Thermodesulfobacteriota bacterium]
MIKAAKVVVRIEVNGEEQELLISPHLTLLEVLRERLELTGVKEGCGEGVCGSCTVLMDGRPIRSCLTLAIEVQGRKITTIEGLAEGDKLHPIQEAFIQHGAIQCGFCTPGMILAAKACLDSNPMPNETQAREAIAANVCRCTGYAKMVEAIMSVGEKEEVRKNA